LWREFVVLAGSSYLYTQYLEHVLDTVKCKLPEK